MKRPLIVGVMGGGHADTATLEQAHLLGQLIARRGWVLLNGGRNAGVMAASARGAAEAGGITVGILPADSPAEAAEHIQIPICTGMGHARNVINVLSSDIVVACAGGAGTLSEVAIAVKCGKTVVCMGFDPAAVQAASRQATGRLIQAADAHQAVAAIDNWLQNR